MWRERRRRLRPMVRHKLKLCLRHSDFRQLSVDVIGADILEVAVFPEMSTCIRIYTGAF
jgi:hypothetical protein